MRPVPPSAPAPERKTAPGAARVHVECIDGATGFDRVRDDWEAIAARDPETSFFRTWTWQSLWWTHYGAGQSLVLLRASVAGRPVGLLPLYLQVLRPFHLVDARVLRLVGTGGDMWPDYLGPILDPAHAEVTARAFADEMLGTGAWHRLYVSDLDPGSPLHRALGAAAGARGMNVLDTAGARGSCLALPDSWDDYLRGVSRNLRKRVFSARRAFERQPGARFAVWTTEPGLDAVFGRLVELHHLRWRARTPFYAFRTPAYVAFHRDLAQAGARNGSLRMYGLELAGRIVAMYYSYAFRGRILCVQGGFDPSCAALHPGLLLESYAIEHAIGEGHTLYDFLRGADAHKQRWGGEERVSRDVTVTRPGWPARLHRIEREILPPIVERAARWIAARRR